MRFWTTCFITPLPTIFIKYIPGSREIANSKMLIEFLSQRITCSCIVLCVYQKIVSISWQTMRSKNNTRTHIYYSTFCLTIATIYYYHSPWQIRQGIKGWNNVWIYSISTHPYECVKFYLPLYNLKQLIVNIFI